MRRFDFKLSYEYLVEKQALKLFKDITGIYSLSREIRAKLSLLKQLTPGDFAILKRRQKISHIKLTPAESLDILTMENNYKIAAKSIGFIK